MYLKATAATLAAWLVGLLIDVNFGGDWQMLYLRVLLPALLQPVLLPVLAMGLCILGELKKK